ncbi:ZIP family metal transporter [Pontibacter silvestris]|uniref:ZIP family metal transporter n=1 Tax=Pontibacter silvestris TaxID=2305183 RepID=A0ABW4X281_9BACT|nr:ZIP family metal transporter [Pontibacter silvestris]MCC9135740.1 ZIP family metal transporter [Pontibacter silvestris]
MIIAILVLFFAVVLSGFLVKTFPPDNAKWLKMALSFSGAYLFSITIIHLLPEVLFNNSDPHVVGYWVLAGFFLQLVLELLSHGVEHGHIHTHPGHHVSSMPYLLLGSLFVHSFLEGSILIDRSSQHSAGHIHAESNFYLVLLGVTLHHVPAAFALMSVLISRLQNFRKAFSWLLIFAVGSPLGIIVSNTLLPQEAPDSMLYTVLTGLVAGNFLHISTTILFETSPDHRFNRNKLVATLLGLLLALFGDFM